MILKFVIEPIHIFYRELPLDKNNIFTGNLAEKNEVEEVRFKKSKECAITGLSINQGINSDVVAVANVGKQEAISNLIQKLVKEKKEPDVGLKIYCEKAFEKIIPFERKERSKVPNQKLIYYNTTTKKQEELEFYDYSLHLENFGFEWQDASIEFKYSVELSTDKKKLTKKINMGKTTRRKLFINKSRLYIYTTQTTDDRTNFRAANFGYFWHDDIIESYFSINTKNHLQE